MKLKKFTKNKKQKRILIGSIVGILVLIGGISLYRTFALYKVEKTFDVLNGTVPDFSSGDVTLAFTVNNKKESEVPFPNKNEGFKVKDVSCENNVQASWDNETWSLTNIKNPDSQSRIKCTINFERYEEQLLNGSYPVLKDGLVPVEIDEKDGTVKKADVTQNWYSYKDKQWANAVILADGVKEPEAGAQIDESQIESYFVWIPKYRYKLFNMGDYNSIEEREYEEKSQPIEIEFGLEDTKDDTTSENYKQCKTPGKSGESGQCEKDYWMTHPAFTAFVNSKGFWVGKFETGYNQSTDDSTTITVDNNWTKDGAQRDENNPSKVIIKPNVYSWRNIIAGNMFRTSYNYERDLDSHMMKNTEWGAVAYLSHSKYGTCAGGSCSEIRINNANAVTGYAAKEIPTIGFDAYKDYSMNIILGSDAEENNDFKGAYNYKNKLSNIASTTGNYTGIYDMSGGVWEEVMGLVTLDESLDSVKLPDNKNGLVKEDITDLKYVDLYLVEKESDYQRRILGDATGELGPFSQKQYGSQKSIIGSWYNDDGYFITNTHYDFIRGGNMNLGTLAGLFATGKSWGAASAFDTFRIVLTPINDVS